MCWRRFTIPILLAALPLGAADLSALKTDVVKTYATFLARSYDDSVKAAEVLETQVDAFVKAPSAEGLEKARAAWKSARGPYLLTEIGRFYGGPIDNDHDLELRINPWPVDEHFIEASADSGFPGLIQDRETYPEITVTVLARLNAQTGEKNITCGWHAIEFMLWGPDLRADGPGQRPWADFSLAPLADRRRAFLSAATHSMVEDIKTVAAAWKPASDNYRRSFESGPVDDAIGHVFTALYQLVGFEIASERLLVAVETEAQEDEPDCFSDTSASDFPWAIQAVESVWTGHWKPAAGKELAGTGLRAFVAALSAETADLLDRKLAVCRDLVAKLPHPLDQAILKPEGSPDKQAMRDCAEALESWADLLAHFASDEKISLDFEHIDSKTRPKAP